MRYLLPTPPGGGGMPPPGGGGTVQIQTHTQKHKHTIRKRCMLNVTLSAGSLTNSQFGSDFNMKNRLITSLPPGPPGGGGTPPLPPGGGGIPS